MAVRIEERMAITMVPRHFKTPDGRVHVAPPGSMGWFIGNLAAMRRVCATGEVHCVMNVKLARGLRRALVASTQPGIGTMQTNLRSEHVILGVSVRVETGATPTMYVVVGTS